MSVPSILKSGWRLILGVVLLLVAPAACGLLSSSSVVNADSWAIDSVTPNRGLTSGGEILTITGSGFLANTTDFAYTGDVQTFTAPTDGVYRFEAWGAQGGTSAGATGGLGGYSSGEISLTAGDIVYVYVGQAGNITKSTSDYSVPATFNGGGKGAVDGGDPVGPGSGGSGGGATDFRLIGGAWNDVGSLRSRIMVAGGGGGGEYATNQNVIRIGGYAGGLTGGAGANGGGGATQIAGGAGATAGQFGQGGNGGYSYGSDRFFGAGGGGGYYGGGSGGRQDWNRQAGGGGSGYISGYTGSVAITSASDSTPKAGCTTGTSDNSCSIHYSGRTFNKAVMVGGNGSDVSGAGNGQFAGNYGDGYARISLVLSSGTVIVGEQDCPILRVSDTEILCTTPAHTVGTVDVEVNIADISQTLSDAYTYIQPTVTSISPNRGSIDGGETVTISGANLDLISTFDTPMSEFAYTGAPQSFIAPKTAWYRLEVWGAQGGCRDNASGCQTRYGRGGYSTGEVLLRAGEEVLVYVGQAGGNGQTLYNGWNAYEVNTNQGKVTSGAVTDWNNGYGGGATDMRIGGDTAWHRFIVAGGGGGSLYNHGNAGYGGGLTGEGSGGSTTNGGTQTSSTNGGFGWGGVGDRSSGGGGWYGGGGAQYASGGGSGFVLTASAQVPTSYQVGADYFLTNATTLGGRNVSIPAVDGTTETGHLGNGFARIEPVQATPMTVDLGGSPCEVTAVTATAITCTTSAHAAGTVDVTVDAAAMQFVLAGQYEYTSQQPFIEIYVDSDDFGMGGVPSELISGNLTVNVKTDNPTGYNLSVHADDVDLSCVSDTSKKILALPATAGLMSDNHWGYAVDANPLSPTTPTTATNWTGLTTGGAVIGGSGTATDLTLGEDTVVWFGTKVDWTLPACSYTGGVTFTAIAW
ncbi:MAG: IPT/TIG domain-containing protein [Candidatus Nomurabacteria bacterium]|jgi:hypothetical protein|nr:IPT/TIG domain-containing protein [Candidatus Nomurabacteria bacterium]